MFASGNDGGLTGNDDDCSSSGLCTSIYTNCIGSISVDGRQAFYDERCSSKMASAFVSGFPVGSIDVVRRNLRPLYTLYCINFCFRHLFQSTTFPNEQCTTGFDGTSAACPVASAIVALALEVK